MQPIAALARVCHVPRRKRPVFVDDSGIAEAARVDLVIEIVAHRIGPAAHIGALGCLAVFVGARAASPAIAAAIGPFPVIIARLARVEARN